MLARQNKRLFAGFLTAPVLLSGCAGADLDAPIAQDFTKPEVVTVKTGNITPSVIGKVTVQQAAPFVLTSNQRGAFKSVVKVGDKVAAGKLIGWNAGVAVYTPVDVVVKAVAADNQDLPKNYPLFELTYTGFMVETEAATLLNSALLATVTGQFQIANGVGPTTCLAIVQAVAGQTATVESGDNAPEFGTVANVRIAPAGLDDNQDNDAAADDTADTSGAGTGALRLAPGNGAGGAGLGSGNSASDSPQTTAEPRVSSTRLSCLIDKGIEVRAGQAGKLSLTGATREQAVILPVNAVAGRAQTGKVFKKQGKRFELTQVELGVSDGTHIEIVSGLKSGDKVLLRSPDLDPRKDKSDDIAG